MALVTGDEQINSRLMGAHQKLCISGIREHIQGRDGAGDLLTAVAKKLQK